MSVLDAIFYFIGGMGCFTLLLMLGWFIVVVSELLFWTPKKGEG